mmetsp:Transcript_16111/g.26249  ORF Transcript_16111/g.26249 Transcript_16111/m.26249 type:complete len:133 (+) Transcript_16111:1-399(+)
MLLNHSSSGDGKTNRSTNQQHDYYEQKGLDPDSFVTDVKDQKLHQPPSDDNPPISAQCYELLHNDNDNQIAPRSNRKNKEEKFRSNDGRELGSGLQKSPTFFLQSLASNITNAAVSNALFNIANNNNKGDDV